MLETRYMDSVLNSLQKRQSTLIKAMRFPLIVMVVFAHSLGFQSYHIDLSADAWNVYHFISEMISHNLCKIAVCWFFVFAGYFFFLNLPKEGLTGKWLTDKWKRRVWTLLIPYLIWNLLPVILTFIKTNLFAKLGLPQTEAVSTLFTNGNNPLTWFLTGPANFPLWFMRDLMIMALISPVVYVIFKHCPRFVSILFLIALYILPYELPVLTWRGYFFFSLGAFLGIQQLSLLALCKSVKCPAAILAIITLLTATFYNDAPFHNWLLKALYPFGMITFMNICDKLIEKESRCDKLCKLSAVVFFIYAAHEVYILGWTKGLFLRVLGDGLASSWISFIFVPIVVLGVCIGLYYLLNRIIPRTLAISCGGRSR